MKFKQVRFPHDSLAGIKTDQHHKRQHRLDELSDHLGTLSTVQHGTMAGPANAHRHSDLANIGADDHHQRDHAARHASGGADEIALSAAQITSGRFSIARMPDGPPGCFLKAGGAGADLEFARIGSLGATCWVVASDAKAEIKDFAGILQAAGYPVWVCDGVNDQVEILAALNALPGDGGTVKLSGGNYIFGNAAVTVARSNVTIAGGNASIDFTASSTHAFLVSTAAAGAAIEDVVIEGINFIGDSGAGFAAYFLGTAALHIARPVLRNCRANTPKGFTYFSYTDYGRVLNNFVVQDLAVETDGIGVAYGTHNEVSHNTLINIGDDGISCYDAPRMLITNNKIINCDDSGITLDYHSAATGCPYSIIAHNYIEGCSGGGGTPNKVGIGVGRASVSCAITGNIILNMTNCDGIVFYYEADRFIASGNTIRTVTGGYGIKVYGSSNGSITGNTISNTPAGIYFLNSGAVGTANNTVTGNTISGTTGTYSIDEASGVQQPNFNKVFGNTVDKPIRMQGESSVAENNSGTTWTDERNELQGRLLAITGDTPGLWWPTNLSGSTLPNVSHYTGHGMWVASDLSGWSPVYSNRVLYYTKAAGADAYMSLADDPDFTFGNGLVDSPFSGGILFKFTSAGVQYGLLCKFNENTNNPEWRLFLDWNTKLVFQCWDASTGGYIGRRYDTPLTPNTWYWADWSYDGSGASAGIKLGIYGVAVATVDSSAGAYTAMEDKAASVEIRRMITAGGAENRFGGSTSIAFVSRGALSDAQRWALWKLITGLSGLP